MIQFCAMRWRLLLALVAMCALPLRADDKALEKYAKNLLEHKAFIIRNFYSNRELEYDGEGNLKNKPETGCWRRGRVLIEKIKLRQDRVELSGYHLASAYDPSTAKFQDFGATDQVSIKISFAKPILGQSELNHAFNTIFLTDNDKLGELVPQPKIGTPPNRAALQVPPGTTAPRVIYSPDPEYTEAARRAHLQGTVVLRALVDERGKVQSVGVARDVDPCVGYGLLVDAGLEQSAMNTVRRWKFQPARKDGKPVMVNLNIEMNFRLY